MVGHFLKMQVSRHDPQPEVACIAWRVFEAARSDMTRTSSAMTSLCTSNWCGGWVRILIAQLAPSLRRIANTKPCPSGKEAEGLVCNWARHQILPQGPRTAVARRSVRRT